MHRPSAQNCFFKLHHLLVHVLLLPIHNCLNGVCQAYFGMLDAQLAEEKIPDEYSGQTQVDTVLSFLLILKFDLCWVIYMVTSYISLWSNFQVILCNDCEKRGTASFHWLYHKCSHCASYNTRLLWPAAIVSLEGSLPSFIQNDLVLKTCEWVEKVRTISIP